MMKLQKNSMDVCRDERKKVVSGNIGWKRKSAITALKVHYYT